jgi:DNA invertase Pin-like site-specific DNA recombinase
LVVWKLDRLARSTRQLLETVEMFERRKIGLKTITQNIDTTNAGGRLIFTVFGAIAEFEREIIRERTRAGLDAARSRGRKGGRPRSLSDKDLKQARALLTDRRLRSRKWRGASGLVRQHSIAIYLRPGMPLKTRPKWHQIVASLQ